MSFRVLLCAMVLCGVLREAASSPVSSTGGSGEEVIDDLVEIRWSPSGVENYTVNQPLVVFLGQTIQLSCPEDRQDGQVYLLQGPANRTVAEMCRSDEVVLNGSQLSIPKADCVQSDIVIKAPTYTGGNIYHFANVIRSQSEPVCSFVLSIYVKSRTRCPSGGEGDCPEPSSSVPVPGSTAMSSRPVTPSPSASSPASLTTSSPSPSPSAAVVSAKPSVLILGLLISAVWWRLH